jgi:hypothetical protein
VGNASGGVPPGITGTRRVRVGVAEAEADVEALSGAT